MLYDICRGVRYQIGWMESWGPRLAASEHLFAPLPWNQPPALPLSLHPPLGTETGTGIPHHLALQLGGKPVIYFTKYIKLSAYKYILVLYKQGSQPTWKTWNFVTYFSRPGKCQEFADRVGKSLNFYLKIWIEIEICKFGVYKKTSFTSLS